MGGIRRDVPGRSTSLTGGMSTSHNRSICFINDVNSDPLSIRKVYITHVFENGQKNSSLLMNHLVNRGPGEYEYPNDNEERRVFNLDSGLWIYFLSCVDSPRSFSPLYKSCESCPLSLTLS